jgi:hypothetical protein
MSKGTKTPHVVIAATKDDTAFKAVALRRQDGSVELLWSRRMPVDGGTWEDFAAECGLAADSGPGARVAAVGLDSAAVAFYQIRVPHVGKEETAAIVRMQAESLLPLPEDQIEVAWRSTPSSNGTVDVTMAAARRDHLCRFVESVRALDPQTIVPACEGAARAWRELFSGRGRRALLLSLGPRNTQLSLVADGLVAAAAALDTGTNDLVTAQDGAVSSESAGAMERFVHDVQVALDSFAGEDLGSCPMFVLSDGDEAIDRIIAGLNAAGMNAQVSLPEAQALRVPPEFGTADIYAYRTPIGLALMRLDAPAAGLNLLERIHATQEQQKAKSAWYSTALAGAVAAVMLVVLVVVAYLTDVASEKRLTALVSQGTFEEARQRQALLKTVARHRPDMLGLLTELSAGDNSGIVLDDFQFKKGQLVAITGRADNTEKMWQYQASLRGQKNIKEVEISNAAQDTKAKKIRFTMVFHYKNFTKKGASL